MRWNQIAAVASGAIALVGAICTAWQIYRLYTLLGGKVKKK